MKDCILRIKDQVNIKFENVDPVIRRQICDSVKYEVPYARHTPMFKMGRWDGKKHFATSGGASYLNLLELILPVVYGADYNIQLIDERPAFKIALPEVDENILSHKVWPKGHPIEGEPVILRDYQVQAIKTYFANLQSVQSITTGAGKTLVTAAISYLVEQHGRTIVIVPSKSLVEQTEEDFINLGLDVGVYYGDRKEFGHQHTISTWQSLSELAKATRQDRAKIAVGEFLKDVVCFQIDECFAADTDVLTLDGWKRIADIEGGETIINYDESACIFKTDTVVKRHTNLTKSLCEKMYRLDMDDGSTVEVTGNHKFLTRSGWVRADELTNDHEIVSMGSELSNKRNRICLDEWNVRLIRAGASFKAMYQTHDTLYFDNGYFVTGRDNFRILRTRLRSKSIQKFIDYLYSPDASMRQLAVIDYRKATSSLGGKALHTSEKGKHTRERLVRYWDDKPRPSFQKGHRPWNYGITKDTNSTLAKLSESRVGSGNPMFGRGPNQTQRERSSARMREAIANGRFTPNVGNRLSHKRLYVTGRNYRSSWELVFGLTNPNLEFETLRVPYVFDGEDRIYVVDFVDRYNRIAYEVKPLAMTTTDKSIAKYTGLNRWCSENHYQMRYIVEEDIGLCLSEEIIYELEEILSAHTITGLRKLFHANH